MGCCICPITRCVAADPGTIDQFNSLIQSFLPKINEAIEKEIPNSYGNCGAGAPSPCQDAGGDLYYKHKKWEYKAECRWIAGLNTMAFQNISLVADSNGNLTGLVAKGTFDKLPASINIQQCVTFDKCTKLFDNTDACCGTDKHFSVSINAACNSTKQLQFLSLSNLKIDDFKITESIDGIKLPPADITDPVHDAAEKVMKQYLTEAFIPYNGQKVTLVDYLDDVGSAFLPQLC